ncbi:hypothetical protein ACIQXU_17620 [Peribacillus sp. NPDC097284]|uniref:hypothetical protein n=1 Tax=Peribacillus sp. NPDC097284 TaxID=3364401 RepID=UPI0037F9FE1E
MDLNRFTNYYNNKMKSNLTKKKRLQTISEYFQKTLKEKVSFADETECYKYIVKYVISKEDEAEEILNEIYNMLEYSYSTQNPNYVYDLKTNKVHSDFFKLIDKTFKKPISYGDFVYKLTEKIKYDRFNEVIECILEYKEMGDDIATGEPYKKDSGLIIITFDLKNKKFISSKSSSYKSHNNIVDFLGSKGFSISPIYILKRALTIKNRNHTEFSPTTLLIINLLYEKIPEMGYDITLDAISFTNLDAKNVQGIKMKGTDLLQSMEILQRIHDGDEVHNLKLSLDKINRNNEKQEYFSTIFTIDLQGKIAFIFDDDEIRESRRREICINLQSSLWNLIYDEQTIERGEQIIHKELPKPESLHYTVSDIRKKMLEIITDKDEKIEVEKFFMDKYPASLIFNTD